MALLVQKFGGTSVADLERISHVADKVLAARSNGDEVVVVLSAMAGETNRLFDLAHGITESPTPREMDVLLSTGEQVTIALLAMALHARGCDARSYTGGQVHIRTDSAADGRARAARTLALRRSSPHHISSSPPPPRCWRLC